MTSEPASTAGEALEVLTMGPREWGPIFRIPGLWKVELLYWTHYLFRFLPLDIWLQARAFDRPFSDFSYGDTPWFTARDILREVDLGPNDSFVDLGSGRGKMIFMANLHFHCEATGIELLPTYVKIARRIAAWTKSEATFLQQDFLAADLTRATVVYACAAALAEETRQDLLLLVNTMQPNTRFITVGWKPQTEQLTLFKEKDCLFSWGREMVYFYRVCEGDWKDAYLEDDDFYEEPRPTHGPLNKEAPPTDSPEEPGEL